MSGHEATPATCCAWTCRRRRRCATRRLALEAAEAAAARAKALADPTRLMLAVALRDAEGELCVCDLSWVGGALGEAGLAPRARAARGGAGALAARRQDGDVRAHRRRPRAGRRRCWREVALVSVDASCRCCRWRPAAPEPEPSAAASRARRRSATASRAWTARRARRRSRRSVAALDGVRAARVSFGNATMTVEGDVDARPRVGGRRARRLPRGAGDAAAGERARRAVLAARRAHGLDARRRSRCWRSRSSRRWRARRGRSPSRCTWRRWRWAAGRSRARRWPALRRRSLDMNVLMTLAAVGAVGIGAYAEGAWVLVLFAVGTTLETYALRPQPPFGERADGARARSRRASSARTAASGSCPSRRSTVGARFLRAPGRAHRARRRGRRRARRASTRRRSPASRSRSTRRRASAVFAGTLNAQGALTVRVDQGRGGLHARARRRAGRGGAGLARAVGALRRPLRARLHAAGVRGRARGRRSSRSRSAATLDTWLYRALALLIVACPCSLVISIPVAVVSAVGRAARDGVLIKGGQALEDLARVRTVAIDKTGTLTDGTPRLSHVVALDGRSDDEALALVAAVERRSEHPLAQALVAGRPRSRPGRRRARRRSRRCPAAASSPASTAASCGPAARAWRAERLGDDARRRADGCEARGETAIVLGEGDRALAVFGLADQPRPEAAAAIAGAAPRRRRARGHAHRRQRAGRRAA